MEQYISKSALVAEIEKRIEEYKSMKIDSSYYDGMIASLEFLYDEFIDTIEVKEVDLEEELESWRHNHFHGRRDKEASGEYLERVSQLDLAKHFFELGMQVSNKIQKGE